MLGEIVYQADQESVAQNLGARQTDKSPAVRATPLHEKLLTGLRYLLGHGDLPLNRNGAAGWIMGDDLWLVSKRTADALRHHLTSEGHSDIPSSNERLFDVLQEHHLLIENHDCAIWRAVVSDESWSHELTLLRVPAPTVWPNAITRPAPFTGTVTPTEAASTPVKSLPAENRPKPAEEQKTPWQFHSPRAAATGEVEESAIDASDSLDTIARGS